MASKIDEQLEQVTVEFINGNKNEISKNNPKFSKIFDWYGSDFKVDGKKDIIGYVNQYSETKINPETEYSFLEYDWSLNEDWESLLKILDGNISTLWNGNKIYIQFQFV